VVSLFETIFIDPITARFALFYILGLLLLIGLAVFYESRHRPPVSGAPRRSKSSLSKRVTDIGNAMADWLVASDITPNQITFIGLILGLSNCALYLFHQNSFWLGIGLALAFPFDSLDGLVARRQGTVSRFGAYLDAVVDRYQEISTCLVIGLVTGWWLLVFFVITGSMLTSYNKARTAIEIPVDNKGWPDLMIQHRRLWLLCFSLAGDGWLPWLLFVSLSTLAVTAHFTAFQRFLRARRMLGEVDRQAMINA
jgi:phosphatidylglycerophosphate synthase